jgi:hypothetical protein
MYLIRLVAAPIQRIVRFPLFQLGVVILIILLLQAADDSSIFGHVFSALDRLVAASVSLVAAVVEVKSFTQSWLVFGLMIAYVYVACLLILYLLRFLLQSAVDRAARGNAWLRNSLARERGIEAYRAWEPLERIRPAGYPQEKWEETYAWPANNEPPYPSLGRRLLWGIVSYLVVALIFAALLQWFTPIPALTWLGALVKMVTGSR